MSDGLLPAAALPPGSQNAVAVLENRPEWDGRSCIFKGGHYLTHVLADYELAIAWFGLVYPLIEKFFRESRIGNVKQEE